jgi:hypothetical protein
MNRMDSSDNLDRKLDQVFAEYRAAFPDPDASAAFMPGLWQRIESRRSANMTVFTRLVQVCVGATLALTVIIGVVLIPHLEKIPVYSASYVDALEADHPNTYVDVLIGDIK